MKQLILILFFLCSFFQEVCFAVEKIDLNDFFREGVLLGRESQVGDSGVLILESYQLNGDYYLVLRGEVTAYISKNLQKVLNTIPEFSNFTLLLSSPGGSIEAINEISDLLDNKCGRAVFSLFQKKCQITTQILPGHDCSSACINIFALGSHRIVGSNSTFQFHGGWHLYGPNAGTIQPAYITRDLLINNGAPELFIDRLYESGVFDKIETTLLTGEEMFINGFADEIMDY